MRTFESLPACPALPVRPMRCTYESKSSPTGRSNCVEVSGLGFLRVVCVCEREYVCMCVCVCVGGGGGVVCVCDFMTWTT